MAEERMLNDEILLGLIKANSGGGGGGTTDYDDLSNKPQIGGVTLSGNKSASDLSLASTADLAGKVDKVDGKGLSTNDYTDADKAIVGGVTAALAGKQDTLTFDSVPTDGSTNPVESNGVYDALATKANASDVTTALALKQDATDNNLTTTSKTVVGAVNELKSGLTDLSEEVNGDSTTYPYADVITIEDAVPANLADCTVKIEPVQDLHGYDKPWVGGAGKNKLPMTVDGIKAANTAGTWSGNAYTVNGVTFTIQTDNDGNVTEIKTTGTANSGADFSLFSSANFDASSWNGMKLNGVTGGSNGTYKLRISDVTTSSFTATNGDNTISSLTNTGKVNFIISISSGYSCPPSGLTFYPMIRLSTETDATFAPYTNICPITGHTEASVQRDGNDVWTGNDSYTIATAGHIIPNTTIALPAGKYALDFEASNPSGVFEFEVFKGNSVDWANRLFDKVFTAKVRNIVEFTLTEASTNLRLYSSNGASISNVRLFSTVQTYTIALGDTIYGGTVRIDSNGNTVMDVTHIKKVLDGTEGVSGYGSTYGRYGITISGISNANRDNSNISDRLVWHQVSDYNNLGDGEFMIDNIVIVRSSSFPTTGVEDMKTYLAGLYSAGTPLEFLFKLATPTTIQLTPTQIQLLKGQNTLTASTGQISVTVNGVSGSIGAVQEQVNELDGEIGDINSILSLKTATAGTNITIVKGGYLQIGKLVIVDAIVTADDDIGVNQNILKNVPSVGDNNYPISCFDIGYPWPTVNVRVYYGGVVGTDQLTSGHSYHIYGSYMCN